MKTTLTKLAIFGLLGAMGGCGGSGIEPGPRLNTVNGHIVFADKQVDIDLANHAVVQFHPKSGEKNGQRIWGSINEGAFSISTEEAGETIPGAPEGDYVVTISPPTPVVSTDPKISTPSVPSAKLIAQKYRDPKTTDIAVHVDEGDNTIPVIELKP